jgi:hypothetical protein
VRLLIPNTISKTIRQTKTRVDDLTAGIQQMIHHSSPRYQEIQRTFNRIIKEVSYRTALLYVDQNGEGNLEPHAEFSEVDSDLHTEEDRGTSFLQMLCSRRRPHESPRSPRDEPEITASFHSQTFPP